MIPQLSKYSLAFPHPNDANEDGIVAWGGDLTPTRLMRAYQNGIFPWYSAGDPIIWWSPNPRFIMELDDFKMSRSLKKSMKKFECKFDKDFSKIIDRCASKERKGQADTWIQPEIKEAYKELFGMGYVHCVATYYEGELVGGLYGVVVGGVFCGESMFADMSDASKVAYATLVEHLRKWGFDFIDCQVPTQHLKSLGAKEVSREYFLERLHKVNMDIIENSFRNEG